MTHAIRQEVTVQKDHQIEIFSPDLKLGDHIEVIILLSQSEPKKTNLDSLFGAGKGGFSSPEEANDFIRRERDTWK